MLESRQALQSEITKCGLLGSVLGSSVSRLYQRQAEPQLAIGCTARKSADPSFRVSQHFLPGCSVTEAPYVPVRSFVPDRGRHGGLIEPLKTEAAVGNLAGDGFCQTQANDGAGQVFGFQIQPVRIDVFE